MLSHVTVIARAVMLKIYAQDDPIYDDPCMMITIFMCDHSM